ncbi:uncharacterized protein LAJ45_04144 [Morchella importuna]|uniref:uncharacterized protein n=1 Tax=Morchella importuna TaxID=1174673 RepID=UPI001E8E367D|nr:uncharacterized protein LAJ45_04144 [Morchella importuna]KAH8151523.1 hypothetical protein LAJ45_04144 [Morchella importuna]
MHQKKQVVLSPVTAISLASTKALQLHTNENLPENAAVEIEEPLAFVFDTCISASLSSRYALIYTIGLLTYHLLYKIMSFEIVSYPFFSRVVVFRFRNIYRLSLSCLMHPL